MRKSIIIKTILPCFMIFLFSCNNAEDKSIDQFFGQFNLEDDCILIPSAGVITTISAINNVDNMIEMDHFGPGGRTVEIPPKLRQ